MANRIYAILAGCLVIVGLLLGCRAGKSAQGLTMPALDEPLVLRGGEAATLCVTGPQVHEQDAYNPFWHYRLNVNVAWPGGAQTLRGYYAADGDAANTGARSGDQWCVRLQAFEPGVYTYEIQFERGDSLAIRPDAQRGEALPGHGRKSSFRVELPSDGNVEDFGWLRSGAAGYPEVGFAERRRTWLKSGTNSPENLLAYADFDGTFSSDSTKTFVKTYAAHLRDTLSDDQRWGKRGERGRSLAGALNYLSREGVNSIYCIVNNIGGDGRDVWPYVAPDTLDRFDVSKLAQWERVFQQAENRGITLQILTQETENETLLDGGNTGPLRKLYYRELVARFGHHRRLIWNLGEENGFTPWAPDHPFQSDAQRAAMVDWFADNDPYAHPVVIHTLPNPDLHAGVLDPLLGKKGLAGISFQINAADTVHETMLRWRAAAVASGHPWMLAMDEIGPWYSGSLPDALDVRHDTLRRAVLWGSLMAGAYGVEWYFGWLTAANDLNAEDFRLREALWRQTAAARRLMEGLPVAQLTPADRLVGKTAWCMAGAPGWLVYLPDGGSTELTVGAYDNVRALRARWFDPVTGRELGVTDPRKENDVLLLVPPTIEAAKKWSTDWVVWVE